jgi:uncharacterized protein YraI
MSRALVALVAVLAVPAFGFAQSTPYIAVVADHEARLRAGPSDQFPETGLLAKGSHIVVQGEEAGWLKIDAPQGQVSWVPTQFIDGFDPTRPTPQRVVVASEGEVTLAAGIAGIAQPLQIRRVKVPNGTLLTVTGPKVNFDGKSWYPVAPPSGDYRYLPKTAVLFDKPASTSFVVRDTLPPLPMNTVTPKSDPAIQQASTSPANAKPVVNHPLWFQAESAERDSKFDDAEKLYFELARLMNGSGGDHDIANLCYTRIHSLREKKRGGPSVVASSVTPPTMKEERTGLLPPMPMGVGSTPSKPNTPVTLPNTNTPATPGANWVGPGMLVRAGATVDGRKTYALESSPGIVRAYVVAAPAVELDQYVNRRVNVYGTSTDRRDLSRPLVVAAAIETVNP